jgi:two-component system NtrC family sensor kinase
MVDKLKAILAKWRKTNDPKQTRFVIPIVTKLTAGFLLIIVTGNIVFTIVGTQLIGKRIVEEAQERVRNDLNSAREIYRTKLDHVDNVMRFTAARLFLRDEEALNGGMSQEYINELVRVRESEGLDILTITDKDGFVVLRTTNLQSAHDSLIYDEIVQLVLKNQLPVAATSIVSADQLQRELPLLAEKAHFLFIDTPMARYRPVIEEKSGMVLKAAAPIFDTQNNFIGVVYGGILLNRNYEIVDKIKETIFQNVVYQGKDIGTATIFQDDLRISTNVRNTDGDRAIGTRIAEDVYNQVVIKGEPWIGRAYVVNDWYITAYEPIRDINNKIIGILYVGILEQKYTDIENQTVRAFLFASLIGVLVSVAVSYLISRQISIPIKRLVAASKELANGNLEAKVEQMTNDEIGVLTDKFNLMAFALKERDEKLKEFAKKKISESERLALIGQLSANVAHELNNPLQGIVTYSHLLLEENVFSDDVKESINKIVVQANRCRDIIRGLLDFSRQKKPDKMLCSVNKLLQGCISLVEKQAAFHNIEVVMDLDNELPMVILDPSQAERVFLNLVINAADAMNGNGQLTLSSKQNRVEKCVEIRVQDTGHGISKENMEKLFEPFFTTKEIGHGAGLGLAISYGIVKEHKGSISVESEVGKGTTFTVSFPLAKVKSDTDSDADNGN